MPRLDALLCIFKEKSFQAFVNKGLYHGLIVTVGVSSVKGRQKKRKSSGERGVVNRAFLTADGRGQRERLNRQGAPVPFSEATPGESSLGGPLSGIQRGTAGQTKTQREKGNAGMINTEVRKRQKKG